jgi:hypothetical protein
MISIQVHVNGLQGLAMKCLEMGKPYPLPVEAKILQIDFTEKKWAAQWKVRSGAVGLKGLFSTACRRRLRGFLAVW